MAKKATTSGGTGGKRTTAKPGGTKSARQSAASVKAAPRKPVRAKAAQPRRAASAKRSSNKSDMSAADALMKLIESPLVADLLAVGATAALAAIAGRGFNRGGGTGSTVKAAGKAAAAAMGRRLSTEVEEIRKASRAKDAARD